MSSRRTAAEDAVDHEYWFVHARFGVLHVTDAVGDDLPVDGFNMGPGGASVSLVPTDNAGRGEGCRGTSDDERTLLVHGHASCRVCTPATTIAALMAMPTMSQGLK